MPAESPAESPVSGAVAIQRMSVSVLASGVGAAPLHLAGHLRAVRREEHHPSVSVGDDVLQLVGGEVVARVDR